MDDVTELALRARRGDADAAAAFVRATQAEVWRVCAHLGSRETADDLTQECYTRAFAGLHRFAGRSAARTWLLSIARRVCADEIRANARHRRAHLAADLPHARDVADTVTCHALLDVLDDERREAFVLTQLVGLSYAEAADVCRCPLGTIRSRVARARADLLDAARGTGSGDSAGGAGSATA